MLKNSLSSHGAALVFVALLGLLGCEREPRSSSVRMRKGAAVAAAASAAVSSDAVAGEREKAAKPGDRDDLGVEQARAGVPLTHATAEQLLAQIKASGKKATLLSAWAS